MSEHGQLFCGSLPSALRKLSVSPNSRFSASSFLNAALFLKPNACKYPCSQMSGKIGFVFLVRIIAVVAMHSGI